MRTLIRTVEPTSEPVTIDDLQDWLPQASGKDEKKIVQLIEAARREVESWTMRSLVTQTWELALDARDIEDCILLPRPPLVSATVKSYDVADVMSTVLASTYTVDTGDAARLWLDTGNVWCSSPRTHRALVVTYVAGYGASGEHVPEEIRRAVKELVTLDYWHPMTGRVSPDGAAPADYAEAREGVFQKLGHIKSTWVAL